MTDDLNYVLKARREKLDALRAAGIEPYAYSFDATHRAADAPSLLGDAEEGPPVRMAGRIVAWRPHGKTTFGHLADGSGRVQLYFRRDGLGEEAYAVLDHFDLGDIIGVSGVLFRTRTGEVTVRVDDVVILTKALRPLPFGKEEVVDGQVIRHSGFADPEQRFRQRYADLAVHPEVRALFLGRSRMVTAIRRFLDGEGYLEMETPVLQPQYGGAAARPFETHHHALDTKLYLRIADELYLKRLLVGGFERVYEIGHDFRNEGIDRTHNPEFTMLEFYQAYADYQGMMTLTERLITSASDALREIPSLADRVPEIRPPFPRVEWVGAIGRAAGMDLLAVDDASLRGVAARVGVQHPEKLSQTKLLDEIFQALVESKLEEPTFIVDYPKALSPLAKTKRGDPALTERFEIFVRGRELANAFSELNDPLDQRDRLEAQGRLRAAGDEEAVGVDEDFLRALEYGMPPAGGVGMGIDRLFMYLTNTAAIREAILFPTLRPE